MVQVIPYDSFANSLRVTIALVVLDCMVVSALLACSAVLVMRRQRGVNWRLIPVWAVMAAIWAWAWYYIWYLVMAISSVISGPISLLGSIYQVLSLLFMYAAICLLFCIFYRLIHMMLGMTKGGRPPTVIRILHWVIFGTMVALSVADFVVWIVYSFVWDDLWKVYAQMTMALYVIYWVASWEITALAILVFVRTVKTGSVIKKPTLALLCSTTIFSALNFMWAIDNLRWLGTSYVWSDQGEYDAATARSFLEIFFCVGIYGSLLVFCLMSGHLSQKLAEDNPTEPSQQQPLATVNPQPWGQRAVRQPLVEADTSHPIVEADGSNIILEMGGSRPIFEADANQYPKKGLEPKSSGNNTSTQE